MNYMIIKLNISQSDIKKISGFSLIEIMVVLIIIGILSSFAYPNFAAYVKNKRQDEAKAMLLDVLAKQEQYRAFNKEYTTDLKVLNYVSQEDKFWSETKKFWVEALACQGNNLNECILMVAHPEENGDPIWELSSVDGNIRERVLP